MKNSKNYKKANRKTLFTALAMGMLVILIFIVKNMIKVEEIQTVMDAFENIQVQRKGEVNTYSSKINGCTISYAFSSDTIRLFKGKNCMKNFSELVSIHRQILKRAAQTEDFKIVRSLLLPSLSILYPDFSKNKILIEHVKKLNNVDHKIVLNLIKELNLLAEVRSFLSEIPLSLNNLKAERLLQINQGYLKKFDISIDDKVIIPYDFGFFTFH